MKLNILWAFVIMALFASCKKKTTQNTDTTSTHQYPTIHMDNLWGTNPLYLNDTNLTSSNTKIVFNTLNYYISNIELEDINGEFHAVNSYELVTLSASQNDFEFNLMNLPANEYVGMRIMFGVDSLRNVSGAQTGALDPAKGMFWNWNTGYIFTKLEGYFNNGNEGSFTYHLGGFQNPNEANTQVYVSFGNDILDTNNGLPQIHINVDWKKFFEQSMEINYNMMSTVTMPGPMAHNLSLRWNNAVSYGHLHQ